MNDEYKELCNYSSSNQTVKVLDSIQFNRKCNYYLLEIDNVHVHHSSLNQTNSFVDNDLSICKLTLIKKLHSSYSIVKYFYAILALILIFVIMSKIFNMIFNRYRILKQ